MKTYKIDDFLNPKRQAEFYKKQLEILEESDSVDRRVIRRQRDPEETELLMQVVIDTFKVWEREGVLERNGRVWKLHLRK